MHGEDCRHADQGHRRKWQSGSHEGDRGANDGRNPAERTPETHASEDFLFPQIDQQDGKRVIGWTPGFLDYLFVAFTTSSAFGPTDTRGAAFGTANRGVAHSGTTATASISTR